MAIKVRNLATWQEYSAGVFERAEHHGLAIIEIVTKILGFVHATPLVSGIEVMGSEGSLGNVMWFYYGGNQRKERFVFSYNHDAATIELRRGTTQGAVVASFSNRSSVLDIQTALSMAVFAKAA